MVVESTVRSDDTQPSKLRVAGSSPAAPTKNQQLTGKKIVPVGLRTSAFWQLSGPKCWNNVGQMLGERRGSPCA